MRTGVTWPGPCCWARPWELAGPRLTVGAQDTTSWDTAPWGHRPPGLSSLWPIDGHVSPDTAQVRDTVFGCVSPISH